MLLVATGKIGSGKSTVLKIFHELGAEILDTDFLVHKFYADPKSKFCQLIVAEFGESILKKDRTINRHILRTLVINDEQKLKRLNEIVHPLIQTELNQIIQNFSSKKINLVEIALLEKIKLLAKFNAIILVRAPLNISLQRMSKRGWSKSETEKIWHSQKDWANPDFVIENKEDQNKLKEQVKKIWEKISH